MSTAHVVAVSQSYRQLVLADGPVSYWRLGDQGATATDETAGNPGTVTGTVAEATLGALTDANKAMTFDGATGYVQIGQPAALRFGAQSFTVECWIKPIVFGNAGVVDYRGTGAAGTATGWGVRYASSGNILISYDDGSGAAKAGAGIPGANLALGVWQHLVVVFTRGGNAIAYINGAQVGTLDLSGVIGSVSPAVGRFLRLAAVGDIAPQFFLNGSLDEVAVYPYALSPAQVALHYRVGLQATQMAPRLSASSVPYRGLVLGDGPLAYWRLDDTGANIVDATGNGHTGTLVGTAVPTPAPSRNLLTVNQASFESALNSWLGDGSVAGAQATWSVFAAWLGTRSVKCTILETSGAAGIYENDVDLPAVVVGQSYVGSAWVFNSQVGTISIRIRLVWFNAANAYMASAGDQVVVIPAGQWTRVNTLAVAAPVNAVRVGLEVMESPAVLNDAFYIDAQQIERDVLSPWQLPGDKIGGAIIDDDGAIVFDAQTSRISTTWTPPILAGQPMSLEAWVYLVGSVQQYPGIFGYGMTQNPCALFLYSDATPAFRQNSATQCCFDARDAAHPLARKVWHHLVGTYDGASARLYVNGALAGGPVAVASDVAISPAFISQANNSGFPGAIDEPAVYPYALSPVQIAAHYLAGRSPAAAIGGSRKVVQF